MFRGNPSKLFFWNNPKSRCYSFTHSRTHLNLPESPLCAEVDHLVGNRTLAHFTAPSLCQSPGLDGVGPLYYMQLGCAPLGLLEVGSPRAFNRGASGKLLSISPPHRATKVLSPYFFVPDPSHLFQLRLAADSQKLPEGSPKLPKGVGLLAVPEAMLRGESRPKWEGHTSSILVSFPKDTSKAFK